MLNAKEKVPKSLDECMVNSLAADNLRSWAEWVEKWGSIVLWLLIIIGSISSIVGNMVFEEYGYNGVEVVDFAVGAFF